VADAGLMQIEWSEGKVLGLAGVSTEVEETAHEGAEARIDNGKRCDREGEVPRLVHLTAAIAR
jgi:hypothetical protein